MLYNYLVGDKTKKLVKNTGLVEIVGEHIGENLDSLKFL